MREIFSILKKNHNAREFFCFTLLFFGGMWTSKIVHPLWFEQHGHLVYFGISYSVMAGCGYFSFYLGHLADRWGTLKLQRAGTLLYVLGLLLRVFPNSMVIAALSGLLAGLGASSVLTTMRPWILAVFNKEDRSFGVAIKNWGSTIGIGLGGILTWLLPLALQHKEISYPLILLLGAIVTLSALFFLPNQVSDQLHIKKTEEQKSFFLQALQSRKTLTCGVIFFGFVSGCYTGLITPYFPVILKQSGIELAMIGLFMAIVSIASAIFDPQFAKLLKRAKHNRTSLFFLGECGFSIFTILLLYPLSPPLIGFVLLTRGILLSLAILAEETIWMEILDLPQSGLYFGLMQSAFFGGDGAGALFGGWLFNKSGSNGIVLLAGALIAGNACLLALFQTRYKKREAVALHETLA